MLINHSTAINIPLYSGFWDGEIPSHHADVTSVITLIHPYAPVCTWPYNYYFSVVKKVSQKRKQIKNKTKKQHYLVYLVLSSIWIFLCTFVYIYFEPKKKQ